MTAFGLTWIDYVALLIFGGAWFGYNLTLERASGTGGLNRQMDRFRVSWMRQVVVRENRVVDTTIMASLQNGAAFFASTSLFAIGGAMALLRSTDEVLGIMANLPLGEPVTRIAWEIKVLGLVVIFVYTFFKFSWSYRIFNYGAILLGAIPVIKPAQATEAELKEAHEAAERAARMNAVAGRHFNRGQRAFFFALAYLSWLIGAYALIVATAAVMLVMWRRQFASEALVALSTHEKK